MTNIIPPSSRTGVVSSMRYPRTSIRIVRYAVQLFFLLLTLVIGYQFYRFVLHFEVPGSLYVQKPPSVDGFLPIAGLMSFKYFLFTGIVEPIHPSAMVMFVAAITVSVALKKGFCGWICPIGTVSQYVWMAGEKLFGRNFVIERFSDASLRSLKYILMSLFLVFIGLAMAPNMLLLFFITDYYKIADVKTMKFFTEMSTLAFWVLAVLFALSFLYKNFWCRYLCPYGALLGLLSRLSPVKIRRNDAQCTHCRACTEHCPAHIDVESKEAVKSAECFGCLTCVSRCPAEGALDLSVSTAGTRKKANPWLYPVVLIVLFYFVIGMAMAFGKWHSRVPYEEYQRLIPPVSSMEHPNVEQ